jgi:hypothetical protein
MAGGSIACKQAAHAAYADALGLFLSLWFSNFVMMLLNIMQLNNNTLQGAAKPPATGWLLLCGEWLACWMVCAAQWQHLSLGLLHIVHSNFAEWGVRLLGLLLQLIRPVLAGGC